jgi:hypothetical protein
LSEMAAFSERSAIGIGPWPVALDVRRATNHPQRAGVSRASTARGSSCTASEQVFALQQHAAGYSRLG